MATTKDLDGDTLFDPSLDVAYQTNHVELKYDAIKFEDVSPAKVTNLFYQTAPIQVVLQSITAQAVAETVEVFTAAGGYFRITEPAKTKFPDVNVTAETLEVGKGALGYVRHIRNGFVLV